MKKVIFSTIIFIICCQKESDKTSNTRDEFIGDYCGNLTSEGTWASFDTKIEKSETRNNVIVFDYFDGVDSVEAIVKGYNLIIPEKTVQEEDRNAAGVYYYDFTVSGNGTLDISKHLIQINRTATSDYGNGRISVEHSIIRMFNSSKYSYIGTFKGDSVQYSGMLSTGDSTTVIVSSIKDSISLDILIQHEGELFGWKKIKAIDNSCTIQILEGDSIKDFPSNDKCLLNGGGQKFGDQLIFNLFAYYGTSLYIMNFSVTKTK